VGTARRFGVLVALGGLVAVPSALAGHSRAVPLTVTITGKGTVRLAGHRVACAAKCRRVISVVAGRRVTLSAEPGEGWKFDGWGGACHPATPRCILRPNHSLHVDVAFIPPGTRTNSIAMGTEGFPDWSPSLGWGLRVLSSQLRASNLIVELAATAHGSDLTKYLLDTNIFVEGRLRREYSPSASNSLCPTPSPNFFSLGTLGVGLRGTPGVLAGQTVTGYLCFLVSPSEAPFRLFTEPPSRSLNPPIQPPYSPDSEAVWFALR
jgi:hypothetical protein